MGSTSAQETVRTGHSPRLLRAKTKMVQSYRHCQTVPRWIDDTHDHGLFSIGQAFIQFAEIGEQFSKIRPFWKLLG